MHLASRLALGGITLLGVLTTVFLLLALAPGEPSDRFSDPRIPRQQSEMLRQRYGFDQPLHVRYVRWLEGAVRGDFGYSHLYAEPARRVLARSLGPTLLLGGSALVVGTLVGLGIGLLSGGLLRGRVRAWTDGIVSVLSLLLYAMPSFWLGLMLLLLVSRLGLGLPLGGLASVDHDSMSAAGQALDTGRHLLLPMLVLAVPLAVEIGRLVRSGLLEQRESGPVQAARARGLGPMRIWLGHGMPLTAVPILQWLGLSAPALLGGTFVVEYVFAWPGLGSALVAAIGAKDYAVVLGCTTLSAALVVLGNLLADLTSAWVDPRFAQERPT